MKHLTLATTVLLLACNSTSPSSEAVADRATVSASAAPAAQPAAAASPSSEPTALTLVADSSQICMVNNQFMGREQIPVEVDGKTYFGCCEMCKGRLARDPSSRSAKDPVSGKLVDKASAVIAKRPSGEVIYFESKDTFERYRI